ncbi:MAG: IS256 family transposase [Methanoregula sp.]|nr:IS256 family transposase [Methanoregula sp.]
MQQKETRAMEMNDFIQDYLGDKDEGLKTLITFFLNLVMQYESEQQAGAKRYERTKDRVAQRNGSKPRTLLTKLGTLTLTKPEFREKSFETVVFEKYGRVEKALINAILESYIQGVSTRKVRHIMEKFGVTGISAETVSHMGKALDEKVNEFFNRPIEQPIIYLIVDAVYVKVRYQSRYVNQAVLIIAGVREDGYREILGIRVADCEDEGFWFSLFEDLKLRGLRGVQLVISDGHKGIQQAVKTSFLGASWQMCQVHFLRAILRNIPNKRKSEVISLVNSALNGYEVGLPEVVDKLERMGFHKAADTTELFMLDVGNYRAFPKAHWKRIRTTNMVERVNAEIKRRTKVVAAFPSRESLMRLIGSILIDLNEEWVTGNRYLNMAEFFDKQSSEAECIVCTSPVLPVVSIADL